MLDGTYVQFFGALLFCLVFLFLWKQSGVVYFGYWSLAWAVESVAWLCTISAHLTGSSGWLAAHAFFEFGFALSLLAAARVSSPERIGKSWRSNLRILYFVPLFLIVLGVELIGWGRGNMHGVPRSLVLSGIYLYNFRQLSFATRRLFHFTLLALSLLYLQIAVAGALGSPAWMGYLRFVSYYDLALKTMLAFSAMAMWIESQNDRVAEFAKELDQVRRQASHDPHLDYLTGLHNQDALQRRINSEDLFTGVVVVCDLDDFKSINDRFGHVVGDEVLRNVGNLLRSSIRAEDCAYRWGGDEFAILFNEQTERLARSRMLEIEARLQDFRVRGHGSQRIQFSWGVAEGKGAQLRGVLETADHEMYARKRERPGRAGTAPAAS